MPGLLLGSVALINALSMDMRRAIIMRRVSIIVLAQGDDGIHGSAGDMDNS